MSGGVPLLVATDLRKAYPPATVALAGTSISLHPGEIHGLLGVNGAGKSTLIKILSGVEQPDSGTITVAGRGEVRFPTPAAAHRAGIGVVHQELPLFAPLTAADNVALGLQSGTFASPALRARARARYREFSRGLPGAPDPDARLEDLDVDAWQIVAIVRALASDARILVLDEPTSSLDQRQRSSLHQTLRVLRSSGLAILYVSHFLDDVLDVADTISVIRDGKVALAEASRGLTAARLLAAMIGDDGVAAHAAPPATQESPRTRGEPVLDVRALKVGGVGPIDLQVGSGECVGLYGLQGCGAPTALEVVFGLRHGSGDVLLGHEPLRGGPNARVRRGLGFLPPERTGGLVLDWDVAGNIAMPLLGTRPFLSFRDRRAEQTAGRSFAATYGLVGAADQTVRSLSGGNQQRVSLGKWLVGGTRCLLANEPTRGVDVRGRAAIHGYLLSLLRTGAGILVYSTDPEELVTLCKRVVVLEHGRVRDELRGAAVSIANLETATRVRDAQPTGAIA